jgi:hypothetical protein
MRTVGVFAVAVVLCAAAPHHRGKDSVRQDRPARTVHATRPASTKHVELQEARDARAALVTLDVAAIIAGMTSAQRARVAALETQP